MDDSYVDALMTNGAVVPLHGGTAGTIRLLSVRQDFPTGRVVCRDGQISTDLGGRSDAVALVPAGVYEVVVVVVEFTVTWGPTVQDMHRGAAVVLEVTGGDVHTWVPATTPGGVPARLPVDYGWGCLLDERFVPDHDEWLSMPGSETAAYEQELPYLTVADGRVLLFDCGMGDGVYDVWHGVDRDGDLARVLVDLQLVSAP